jgi:hypothetical protein
MSQLSALKSTRASASPWVAALYGLLFVAAIAILVLTVSNRIAEREDLLTLSVVDEAGEPLEGAEIAYGDRLYRSGDDGTVRLSVPEDVTGITVGHEGYSAVTGEVSPDHSRNQTVTLVRATEPPEPEAPDSAASTTTDAPSPAATTAPATQEVAVGGNPGSLSTPTSTTGEIAGTLRNIDGEPVASGWVTDGTSFAFSDADGHFVFEASTIPPDATLTIFASGYHQQDLPVPASGQPLQVTLDHQMIKGIYYNPNIANTEEEVDRLVEIATTTEVNAIVIDIKEELIFYDTNVQFFRDAGIVNPIMDLPAVLQRFEDAGIYTIARLVVFKDSAVAEKFPELAVLDSQTGGLWRDMNGVAWVNPMDHTLWDANIELAYEAATLGFDEIQYDYIRFPTDGDLSRVAYGIPNSQENREAAIEKFLQRSYERLIPTGAKLSADVFGYTVLVQDDLGIGQNLDQLAPHVDFLSPMVYPSHWPEGSLAVDGHPNDFPYETIEISMGLAVQQLDGQRLKLRPWLQDFDYWIEGSQPYGDAEVRAQIDAVEDLGLSGWLIWDPNNRYHDGAYLPEPDGTPTTQPATPAVATPSATTRATISTRRR